MSPRNWSSRNRPETEAPVVEEDLVLDDLADFGPNSRVVRSCSMRPPCPRRANLARGLTSISKESPPKLKARRRHKRCRTRSRSYVARSLIVYDSQRFDQQLGRRFAANRGVATKP